MRPTKFLNHPLLFLPMSTLFEEHFNGQFQSSMTFKHKRYLFNQTFLIQKITSGQFLAKKNGKKRFLKIFDITQNTQDYPVRIAVFYKFLETSKLDWFFNKFLSQTFSRFSVAKLIF